MATKSTETIAISEFKATWLAVLERVRRTGTSIVVTKRGEPVAKISSRRRWRPPATGAYSSRTAAPRHAQLAVGVA